MKKLHLGRNGKTEVMLMNEKEFLKFMENKTVYHHTVNWIEKWKGTNPITTYFPYNGFTLPNYVKLSRYDNRYPETCYGAYSNTGKFYGDYPRYIVTIRKTKNAKLFYVTKK